MALFDSGTPLSNVALSDPFSVWSTLTNQINTQAAGLASNNIFTGTLNTFNNSTVFNGTFTAPRITANTGAFTGPVTSPSVTANTITKSGSALLIPANIDVTIQSYDATFLNAADIGVTVQGYDATLLESSDIGVTVQSYNATYLNNADIGTTVQGYDAGLNYLDGLNFTDEPTFKSTTNLEPNVDLFGYVTPGQSGNRLTSTGSGWTSSAPASIAGSITATAAGAISDGDPVIVNANGTVSTVTGNSQVVGTFQDTGSDVNNNDGPVTVSYDVSADRILLSSKDTVNEHVQAVGITGTTASFNTILTNNGLGAAYSSTSTYHAAANVTILGEENGKDISAISISGNTCTLEDQLTVTGTNKPVFASVYDESDQKVIITINESTTYLSLQSVDFTGGVLSLGTLTPISGNYTNVQAKYVSMVYDSVNNDIVVFFSQSSGAPKVVIYSCSGGTFTLVEANPGEPPVQGLRDNAAGVRLIYDSVNNKFIFYYQDDVDGNNQVNTVVIATRSGNTFTYGDPVVIHPFAVNAMISGYNPAVGVGLIGYKDNSNLYVTQVACDGLTPVINTTLLDGDVGEGFGIGGEIAYVSSTGQHVIGYEGDGPGSPLGLIIFEIENGNLTQENFIGFSSGAYANNATATIAVRGSLDDAQTGLTPGQKYYVRPNGVVNTTPHLYPVEAGIALTSTSIVVKG